MAIDYTAIRYTLQAMQTQERAVRTHPMGSLKAD
jgi:hypothetical protein